MLGNDWEFLYYLSKWVVVKMLENINLFEGFGVGFCNGGRKFGVLEVLDWCKGLEFGKYEDFFDSIDFGVDWDEIIDFF